MSGAGGMSRLMAARGTRAAAPGRAPRSPPLRDRQFGCPCRFCGGQHAGDIVCGMMSDEDARQLVRRAGADRAG